MSENNNFLKKQQHQTNKQPPPPQTKQKTPNNNPPPCCAQKQQQTTNKKPSGWLTDWDWSQTDCVSSEDEMDGNVYLTTHSTHFIYGYMASDIL